jgi:hypothetical protein
MVRVKTAERKAKVLLYCSKTIRAVAVTRSRQIIPGENSCLTLFGKAQKHIPITNPD